jgi:hypothetical protein
LSMIIQIKVSENVERLFMHKLQNMSKHHLTTI